MIRFRNLTKSYGTGRGVFDLSFEITDGEVSGLLGPENSGKTTIFSLFWVFPPRETAGALCRWKKLP